MSARCVIDVGNTSITSGLYVDGEILAPSRIATDLVRTQDDLESLIENVAARSKTLFTQVVACVGVTRIREYFDDIEKKTTNDFCLIDGANLGGANISYDSIDTLGPDRITNSIAAAKLHSVPVIVVDCGTAITIDVVDGTGTFIGGLIAPGVEIARDALTHFAPSLPDVELLAPEALLGTDTISCIQSGVLNGAAGMIDSIVAALTEQHPSAHVVLTGGHSALIQPLLMSEVIHDEWLTLRGLGLAELS